jgi:arylsulfatase B
MPCTVDLFVGQIVDALHVSGMWEDTLLVFHADNGGEIMTKFCRGNNYPLRGGKFSQFEGGIRGNALVNGGYLPAGRRGQVETALMSVADWYSTFLALVGLDAAQVVDKKAVAAALPALDSVNCWPLISGEALSCRSEIAFGDTSALGFNGDGDALVGALIRGRYKLLLGPSNKGYHVGQDILTGPFFPNSSIIIPELHPKECNRSPTVGSAGAAGGGCLFDIYADPSEENNLAESHTELFLDMLARLDVMQQTVYSPNRGKKSKQACEQAKERGWYSGPFLGIQNSSSVHIPTSDSM